MHGVGTCLYHATTLRSRGCNHTDVGALVNVYLHFAPLHTLAIYAASKPDLVETSGGPVCFAFLCDVWILIVRTARAVL